MDCYAKRKAKNKNYTGEWNYRKHQVKLRDKGLCAYCGRAKQRIVAHHINHDSSDHRMENLVTLCEPCHGHYHHTVSESVQKILRDHFSALVTG
jgi:5-methylcytosine-specific restriction endonuclease McrA